MQGKARQGKARQGKARQGKARQGKASEIVVIGSVGDIARTDGTEWAGPVSGAID